MEPEFRLSDTIALAFATPLLRRVMPDAAAINPRLRQIILERERADAGVARSNVGGWHSREDLLDWPHPEIGFVRRAVGEAVREMTNYVMGQVERPLNVQLDGGAWANVCRDGSYHKIHNHPDCTWSGVYYVSVGERDPAAPAESGTIEFLDPRMGATAIGTEAGEALPKLRIVPEPGLILLFPSWLYHYVNPFRGSGERISIAFNVKLRFAPAGPAR